MTARLQPGASCAKAIHEAHIRLPVGSQPSVNAQGADVDLVIEATGGQATPRAAADARGRLATRFRHLWARRGGVQLGCRVEMLRNDRTTRPLPPTRWRDGVAISACGSTAVFVKRVLVPTARRPR